MMESHFRFAIFLFNAQFVVGCVNGAAKEDEQDCDMLATLEENVAKCNGICVSLATHPHNCGACGHSCDEVASTDCVNGRCSCVSSDGQRISDGCDLPSVCDSETGLCLTPDSLGEPCDEIEGVFCENIQKVCVDGYCTAPNCNNPEICDLLDNDCDGWLDELPGSVELTQNCYSGPPETVGIGICQKGLRFCVAGSLTLCQGEQSPVPECGPLAFDGHDNDCNYCIDGRIVDGALVCGAHKADLVFMIDISGSMVDKIAAIKTAIDSFGGMYGSAPNIRWSIERVSVGNVVTFIDIYHALSSFPLFQAAMSSLMTLGGYGGIEPTYDAVWKTAIGDFDAELGVDPGAVPIYIVFSDEAAQTIMGKTENEVCEAVNAKNAILAVFTTPEFYVDWDMCASIYLLSDDPILMNANLNDLFGSICGL